MMSSKSTCHQSKKLIIMRILKYGYIIIIIIIIIIKWIIKYKFECNKFKLYVCLIYIIWTSLFWLIIYHKIYQSSMIIDKKLV